MSFESLDVRSFKEVHAKKVKDIVTRAGVNRQLVVLLGRIIWKRLEEVAALHKMGED